MQQPATSKGPDDPKGDRSAHPHQHAVYADPHTVYAAVTSGIVIQDAQGAIVYANDAAQQILELSLDQLMGRFSLDPRWQVTREDGSPLRGSDHPAMIALRTGMPQRFVVMGIVLPNGERRWLQVDALPVHEVGRGLEVVSTFIDITQRRIGELAQMRLAAIVESSDDAIIGKSLDGIVESWNAGATRLYGYTAQEAIGRHIAFLTPDDRADEIGEILVRVRRGERIVQHETVRRRKDGAFLHVALTISPIRNRTGTIIGAATIARDITGQVRAQHEVERARFAAEELAQLRSDFVAAVSHELRTPLTAILGYSELLQSRWTTLEDQQRQDWVRRMAEAASRQMRLVEDLLLLTQVESDSLQPRPQAAYVATIIAQVAREAQGSYHGQRFDLDGPEDLRILADAERSMQILANLIDNAAKYSPEGSPVVVTWRREGGMAAIRVRDYGSGIPQEGRDRLFTRFGRIPGSRIRAGHVGTGLGLFLGRHLAHVMGGELGLEATGPEGSTFRLRLPAD